MKRQDLLGTFVHHPVVVNLFMLILLLAGLFAVSKLNVQFFPNFNLDFVTVRVDWRGVAAEDVEEGLTTPLEQKLKSVAGIKHLTSASSQGISSISVKFKEGTDPITAVDEVKQAVDQFRNLPQDAEPPEVSRVIRYESIARVLLTGGSVPELRRLARQYEQDLLGRGIDKVDLLGLPDEAIAITVAGKELERLGLTLDQVATRIGQTNRDLPAGKVGEGEVQREVRGVNLRRDPRDYQNLPVVTEAGSRIELSQIAEITRGPSDNSLFLQVNGKPAVELLLKCAEKGNSLTAAKILNGWLADARPKLPPNIQIQVYDEQWSLIEDRIGLLVSNGIQGLIIVVLILLLFLNGRVTAWVAMGIPTAFLATLAVGLLAGGRVKFTFFPMPEPQVVYANATFASGTPRAKVDAFLEHLRQGLDATEKGYGAKIIQHAVFRSGALAGDQNPRQGEQFGSITVELTPSEKRSVRTETFIKDWQARIKMPAGIENFVVVPRKQGPPGGDLVIRLAGQDAHTLKLVSLDLQASLRQVVGVYGIEDDMPYGREQVVFNLTSAGEALGLTLDDLSRQLRAGLDGKLVQLFQDGPEEVEVRVRLPAVERASLNLLECFTVRTPNGDWVPLATVARWTTRQGFEALRHAESQLAVEVNATVNSAQANSNEILAGLAFTTILALLWLPAMLSFYESGHVRLMRLLGRPVTA